MVKNLIRVGEGFIRGSSHTGSVKNEEVLFLYKHLKFIPEAHFFVFNSHLLNTYIFNKNRLKQLKVILDSFLYFNHPVFEPCSVMY